MCSMCCPFNTIKDRACFIDKCFKIEMTRATTQAIRNQIVGMAAGGTPLILSMRRRYLAVAKSRGGHTEY